MSDSDADSGPQRRLRDRLFLALVRLLMRVGLIESRSDWDQHQRAPRDTDGDRSKMLGYIQDIHAERRRPNIGAVGCYIIERPDHPDAYFGRAYPALAEDWDDARVVIAWWPIAEQGEFDI